MSKNHVPLNRRRWARLRRRIFDRDGWRCRRCGKAGRLECDHVRPIEDGGDPWDPENLQALCRNCHISKTRGENQDRNPPAPALARWREFVAELEK